METGGSIVVIVIAWWIAFQALLPIGVRSPAEEGVKMVGDPGAPTNPRLLVKGVWSMVIALIVWAVLYAFLEWSGLKFTDLPSP